VGGIAGQQNATRPVVIGQPVVDTEPGTPRDAGEVGGLAARAARGQQGLHVGRIWVLGRVLGGGDEAVAPVPGQRRYHDQPVGVVVQHDLIARQRPVHPHVGQHE
jgi:hypothetical protein